MSFNLVLPQAFEEIAVVIAIFIDEKTEAQRK